MQNPLFLTVTLGLVFQAAFAFAQTDANPVDRAQIGLHLTQDIGRGALYDYWQVHPGASIFAETPFYALKLQGGMHLSRFTAESSEQPDFTGANLWAGIGYELDLPLGITWFGGPQIGVFQMVFDGVTGSMKWELEIALGGRSRISVPVHRSINADVGFSFFHVYTNIPINLLFPSVGLSYTFESPTWLRNLIQ